MPPNMFMFGSPAERVFSHGMPQAHALEQLHALLGYGTLPWACRVSLTFRHAVCSQRSPPRAVACARAEAAGRATRTCRLIRRPW